MTYKLQMSLLLLGALVACSQAACPPTKEELKPIIATLEAEFEKLKPLKPGMDPADAEFVVQNVAKHIVTSSEYAPCNKGFDWNKDVSKDAEKIKTKCYKPGDYTTKKTQDEFMKCAKGQFPPLLLRYAKPGLAACSCFEKDIIPNWKGKYEAKAQQYVANFKSFKSG